MRPSLTGRHNTALIAKLHAEDQAHEAHLKSEADRKLRERNEDIYLRYIRGWFGIRVDDECDARVDKWGSPVADLPRRPSGDK